MNNILETEHYLTGQLAPEDQLVYDARLIVDQGLKEQTNWQQHTYEVIRAYGHMRLRNQLDNMHDRLMNEPQHTSFRNKIRKIFSR